MIMEKADSYNNTSELKSILSRIENDSKIKVISFDVFDTAVFRPFLQPTDLFRFMTPIVREMTGKRNYSFHSIRVSAEHELRQELRLHKETRDLTLSEIYNRVAYLSSLDAATAACLMQREIELEIQLCHVNPTVLTMFNYAKKVGKRLIFASDMYLDSETIGRIVTRAGYEGFEQVIVSSEVGASKHNGGLYNILCHRLAVDPHEVFHVGDNKHADFDHARANGISACLIKSPRDFLLDKDSAHTALWGDPFKLDFPTSMLVAMAGNKGCHSCAPKANSTLFNGSLEQFGYYAVGVFLYPFLAWMRRQAMRQGIDHIFFLSRDGYLPLAAWNALHFSDNGGPKASYMHISRRAMVSVSMYYGDMASTLASFPVAAHMTVKEFITARFDVDVADIILQKCTEQGISASGNARLCIQALTKFFIEKQNDIKAIIKPEAERATRYFTSQFAQAKNPAIFDVGCRGTFQNILPQVCDRHIYGFYVTTNGAIAENVSASAHSVFLEQQSVPAFSFRYNTVLYEVLLSEAGLSVAGWSKDGEPHFVEDTAPDADTAQSISQIQKGTLDMMHDIYTLFGHSLLRYTTHSTIANRVLWGFWENRQDINILNKIRHEDSSYNKQRKLLIDYYAPRQPNIIKGKHIVLYVPAMTRSLGGAERMAANLSTYLQEHGYSVSIITMGTLGAINPMPLHPLPESVIVRHVRPTRVAIIRDMLKELKPDALIVMSSGHTVINFISATMGLRIPVLLAETGEPETSRAKFWEKRYRRYHLLMFMAASTAVVHFPSYRSFFPFWLRPNIIALPNAVMPPLGKNVTEHKKIILCVGRIELAQKQQHLLVEAFALIADDFPEWEVHFYGEEYERDGALLLTQIIDMDLSKRVFMQGQREDIFTVYASASIFAFPSKYEGFPNSLAEALASGLPAVGFASCSGTNELIKNGQNGFLVDDVKGLAAALAKLMTSQDERERMSAAAISLIQKFSPEIVFPKWKNAIDKLLKKKRKIFSTAGPAWPYIYRPLAGIYTRLIKKKTIKSS